MGVIHPSHPAKMFLTFGHPPNCWQKQWLPLWLSRNFFSAPIRDKGGEVIFWAAHCLNQLRNKSFASSGIFTTETTHHLLLGLFCGSMCPNDWQYISITMFTSFIMNLFWKGHTFIWPISRYTHRANSVSSFPKNTYFFTVCYSCIHTVCNVTIHDKSSTTIWQTFNFSYSHALTGYHIG